MAIACLLWPEHFSRVEDAAKYFCKSKTDKGNRSAHGYFCKSKPDKGNRSARGYSAKLTQLLARIAADHGHDDVDPRTHADIAMVDVVEIAMNTMT